MTMALGDETTTAEVNSGWSELLGVIKFGVTQTKLQQLLESQCLQHLEAYQLDAIVNTGWSRASWGNGPWNDNAFVPIAELTGMEMQQQTIGSVYNRWN